MEFKQLGIINDILKVIQNEGYTEPSAIQKEAIPVILAKKDVLGSAQTGTGKTAAFAIPLLQEIAARSVYGNRQNVTALVLAPTRELAEQIKDTFKTFSKYLNLKIGAVYGGVAQRGQEKMLEKGVDVLVATPGRLIDLVRQKVLTLNNVKTFVLDEADTMLDMGFIKDVKFIQTLLKNNEQTLMFSATISSSVSDLASQLLKDPVRIETAPPQEMLQTISHTLIHVEKLNKRDALIDLLANKDLTSVLLFSKTKHGANKLQVFLESYGIKADAIHSNKSQNKRQNALNDFKANKIRVLVATDIAARGIDISGLSHVINYDVPLQSETYVHRIGRTGRAGLFGAAITLCSPEEKVFIKAIKRETDIIFDEQKFALLPEEERLVKIPNFTAVTPKKEGAKKSGNDRERGAPKSKAKTNQQNRNKARKQKEKRNTLLAESNYEDKKFAHKTKIVNEEKPVFKKNDKKFHKPKRTEEEKLAAKKNEEKFGNNYKKGDYRNKKTKTSSNNRQRRK